MGGISNQEGPNSRDRTRPDQTSPRRKTNDNDNSTVCYTFHSRSSAKNIHSQPQHHIIYMKTFRLCLWAQWFWSLASTVKSLICKIPFHPLCFSRPFEVNLSVPLSNHINFLPSLSSAFTLLSPFTVLITPPPYERSCVEAPRQRLIESMV